MMRSRYDDCYPPTQTIGVVAATNVTEALKLITTEISMFQSRICICQPGRWLYRGYRNAPLPTKCPHAAGQRLPRRSERHGRYPFASRRNHREPFDVGRLAEFVHDRLMFVVAAVIQGSRAHESSTKNLNGRCACHFQEASSRTRNRIFALRSPTFE